MSADAATDDIPADEAGTLEASAGAASVDTAPGGAGTRHRRPVGPLVAIGVAIVLVVAAIVVALVGGDDVSATAVRVGGTEVSQKTFNTQLRGLAPVLRDQGAPATEFTSAFVPTSTSAQLAQIYVATELLRGRVDVSDADREQLETENREELGQYAPALRRRIVDLTLMQNALVAERGDEGANQFVRRVARRADVYVDPRYGFWNPASAQVCPPTGCVGAAAGG